MNDKRYLFQYDYYYQTVFHWAAKRSMKEMLLIFLEYGIHLNVPDMKGRIPLHLAAQNNDIEIVRILIEHKSNPFLLTKDNKKPLDLTTDANIKEMLREYMDVNITNIASRSNEFKKLFQNTYSKIPQR